MAAPWTKAAHAEIRTRAESGDAQAQRDLATMLASGAVGRPNYREAFRWYRLAAISGDSDAKYNLGLMYLMGEGVEPNRRAGYDWLKRAAADGNDVAAEVLGQIYENGAYGFRRSTKTALKWYHAATSRGNAKAKLSLGVLYFSNGTLAEKRKGLRLIRAAARAQVAGAQEALKRLSAHSAAADRKRTRSNSRA